MTASSSRAEALQYESNKLKTSPERRVTSSSNFASRGRCPAHQVQGSLLQRVVFVILCYRVSFLERELGRIGAIFKSSAYRHSHRRKISG